MTETLSKSLTRDEIVEIGQADDFHIAPFRADGVTYGTPTWIWSVEVNGELFVRAYNGVRSRWYQSAMAQKEGMIRGAGMTKHVRFASAPDALTSAIDEAYKAKYSSSPYLSSMISQRATEASVQILPGEE